MVEVRVPDIDMVLSYGHAEYVPPFPDGTAVCVWPSDSMINDMDSETLLTWIEEHSENVEEMTAKWVEITGLPAERLPEADLQWESIYRVRCTREQLITTFEMFMLAVDTTPSGDDDTFDYWPSGARLLITMGTKLGPQFEQRAVAVVRALILERMADWAGELLLKTNTWQEGDPQ